MDLLLVETSPDEWEFRTPELDAFLDRVGAGELTIEEMALDPTFVSLAAVVLRLRTP